MTDQLPANRSTSAFKQAIVGGYDRDEVDEYVAHLERRIEALEQERTPDGAVQRRLEQVGDEVAGILQRAHETADQLTQGARDEASRLLEAARTEAEQLRESSQREAQERTETARREADERIGASHRDAAAITANAQTRLQELDVDADRIWAERERILADIRFLSDQLNDVVRAAAERFPADEAGEATDEVGLEPGEPTDEVELEPAEATDEVAALPAEAADEAALLPGDASIEPEELAEADDATQQFDVEELFADEDEYEDEDGPELAGD